MKGTVKKWYLLAYDIRNPRRLQRTHAYVKKKGVALQKSVFLVRTDNDGLAELKNGVRQLVDSRRDDVRLYPVGNPSALWAAGRQQDAINTLFPAAPSRQPLGGLSRLSTLFFRKRKK